MARRKEKKKRLNSTVDDGGIGFTKDNAIDFYPDGVEDPKIIEKKYTNQAERQFKSLENKLLKILLS